MLILRSQSQNNGKFHHPKKHSSRLYHRLSYLFHTINSSSTPCHEGGYNNVPVFLCYLNTSQLTGKTAVGGIVAKSFFFDCVLWTPTINMAYLCILTFIGEIEVHAPCQEWLLIGIYFSTFTYFQLADILQMK